MFFFFINKCVSNNISKNASVALQECEGSTSSRSFVTHEFLVLFVITSFTSVLSVDHMQPKLIRSGFHRTDKRVNCKFFAMPSKSAMFYRQPPIRQSVCEATQEYLISPQRSCTILVYYWLLIILVLSVWETQWKYDLSCPQLDIHPVL